MGKLVADWALWAGRQPLDPMADPGGPANAPADLALIAVAPRQGQAVIAADLVHDAQSGGTVTFGAAWNAVGFGDPVMTVTVTGRQLHDALEEQWAPAAGGGLGFSPLAVSGNVRYTFDATGPVGKRIDPAEVFIDGEPLDEKRTYRLAAPSYTLINQDGFSAFLGFTEPVRHTRDFESFVAFVRQAKRLTPAATDRVRVKNATGPGARTGTVTERPRLLQYDGTAVPRPEAALRTARTSGTEGGRAAGGFRVPC